MKHKIEITFETDYTREQIEKEVGSLNMCNYLTEHFIKKELKYFFADDTKSIEILSTFMED